MKTRSTKNAARPLMTKKAKNSRSPRRMACCGGSARQRQAVAHAAVGGDEVLLRRLGAQLGAQGLDVRIHGAVRAVDRKSTRLNSSHLVISYAVFCLKKKKNDISTVLSMLDDDLHTLICRHRS